MLTITIPGRKEGEMWDEENGTFVYTTSVEAETLALEHSLISISKWEAKYNKSFIDSKDKTSEEMLDYIKMMSISKPKNPEIYDCLTKENVEEIVKYMEAPMTATTIKDDGKGKRSRRFTTSELIYCWMVQLNIPFECQKWHIARLITLIRVCNEENKTPTKKKRGEIARDYAAINAANRKKFKSKG